MQPGPKLPTTRLIVKHALLLGVLLVLGISFARTYYAFAQSSSDPLAQENQATPTATIPTTLEATPSPVDTHVEVNTATPELPLIPLFTPTATFDPILEPSALITDSDSLVSYLPLIMAFPSPTPVPPPVRILVCDHPNAAIPDNNLTGISKSFTINQPGYLVDLNAFVSVSHTWVGDLTVLLRAPGSTYPFILVDRPGVPGSTTGCGNNSIQAIFDDQASQTAENKCTGSPAAIGGAFQPVDPLGLLFGTPSDGQWTITVVDSYTNDTGTLNEWCLEALVSSVPPTPISSPPPVSFPPSASTGSISGKNQSLSLDCESRSAVDWANFFGTRIAELDFFNNLPVSDNPDKGFVGNVYGTWGQIPPNDYGVHAEPVAALLRQYGLSATAVKHWSWDRLRAEIASNRPVIVWVIGSVTNGAPKYYVANSDGEISVVARYEHTVIVTGYTGYSVTVLDGGKVYTRTVDQFLDSWSVLQNMAVIAQP